MAENHGLLFFSPAHSHEPARLLNLTPMKRIITIALGVILIAAAGYYWTALRPQARFGAGYQAKVACSEIFLAGRDPKDVLDAEFAGMADGMETISVHIDQDKKTATASAPLGIGKRRAIYREGYGCTLFSGGAPDALAAPEEISKGAPWPVAGESADWPESVDRDALRDALDDAFADNDLGHRAVIVVVDGVIVGERYAPGFSKDTPLLSWSMGKSVTASLVGAAEQAGYLDTDEPVMAPEWGGDPARAAITWDNLLRMSSGLAFEEDYFDPASDVSRMLWEARNAGAIAADEPLAHPPGEFWAYSSGTTNLIARSLADLLAKNGVDIYSFAGDALFGPIGATSFTLEPDPSGDFIGSSFIYATARDWARLGELYLNDGVANGKHLLPEGWTDYVATPTANSDDQYGAQFWLNRKDPGSGGQSFPGLPEEAYFMNGHEGQFVIIIPSAKMVIVRLGLTRGQPAVAANAPFVAELYAAAHE